MTREEKRKSLVDAIVYGDFDGIVNHYDTLERDGNVLVLKNTFSCISKHGYNEGDIDFSVSFPLDNPDGFTIEWTNIDGNSDTIEKHGATVKDALYDTFSEWLGTQGYTA